MKSKTQFESKQLENIFVNLSYLVGIGDIDYEEIENDVEVYVKHYTGIQLSVSPEHTKRIKEVLTSQRDILSHLLKSIIKSLNKQIDSFDTMKSELKHIQDFVKKYPFYVKPRHPKEAIKFFDDKLRDEKDIITYIRASELLDKGRTIISGYVKKGTHGFKDTGIKGVSKQEVYNYYVEYICKKRS